MKVLKVLVISFVFLCLLPFGVSAQESSSTDGDVYKGRIIEHSEVSCGGITEESEYSCISYSIEILEGENKGDIIETSPTWLNNSGDIFKDGSKVYISQYEDLDGQMVWNVESYSREGALLTLLIMFVVLIVIITGGKGLSSTLGLIMSFFVLYSFAIPELNNGSNIFLISAVTILALLVASTFVTYGFNTKSLIAFVSTFMGILLILLLGCLVISWMNISGTGEESSAMLYESTSGVINLSNIYLLSIVIGALGVLDDVTVGQTSAMMEIYQTDKSLTSKQLFKKSMNIGKDHIASMINTLFIAYAGSSFSLVMLLSLNNPDFRILVNTGFVVEEIVRTLVASIGLILVVPLTSFFASRIVVRVLK